MSWILILGAKSDIAKEVAHKFAKEGFNIYLAARDLLSEDAKDLEVRYQVKAQALLFDAIDYKSHQEFYQNLQEKPLGAICVVGYLTTNRDASALEQTIAVNYIGCASILNVIADDFEQRGRGFIVGISSVAADRGRQSNYLYASAKAAFSTYLSGLRNRLFAAKIQVITVQPGFVYTKMTENLNLPGLLTAKPEQVAIDIYKAWKKKKNFIYTRWYWRFIMLIIKMIPESIFKRLSL